MVFCARVPGMARRVAACALLLLAAGSGAAPGGPVLTIRGPEELEAALAAHPVLVVAFTAPWCGHCRRLVPEYRRAAEALAAANASAALAQVDATDKANEGLAARYSIHGYPMLKVFRGGSPEARDYRGPRNAEGIQAYLHRLLRPPAAPLGSREEVEAHLQGAGPVVVHAFLPGGNASAAGRAFLQAADALREDVEWGYTDDHELLEHCSGADCRSPFLALHKPAGGGSAQKGSAQQQGREAARYEGEFDPGLLRSWVESHSTPLLIRYNEEDREAMLQYLRVMESSLPKFFLVVEKESDALAEQLTSAAAANDDLKFILASAGRGRRVMGRLGLKRGDLPAFAILDTARGGKTYLKLHARESELAEWIFEFKQDPGLIPPAPEAAPGDGTSGGAAASTASAADSGLGPQAGGEQPASGNPMSARSYEGAPLFEANVKRVMDYMGFT